MSRKHKNLEIKVFNKKVLSPKKLNLFDKFEPPPYLIVYGKKEHHVFYLVELPSYII